MPRADRAGLITLAKDLLALAQDVVPAGAHVHHDPDEDRDDESEPLAIERR